MVAFALIICLGIAIAVQRIVYDRLWDKNLKVNVAFQERTIEENQLVKVDVTVSNGKLLPLPALTVAFSLPQQFVEFKSVQRNLSDTFHRNELFTLFGNQAITRTLTFKCRKRGLYFMDEVLVSNQSLFMDQDNSEILPMKRQIIVYPKCVNMTNFIQNFQKLFGEIIVNDFYNEDVFLIRGVRDYQPFDSQRSINWNATARMGSLMVNNYEYTDSRKVAVFLNLTKFQLSDDQEISEESIRLAKTWCQNLDQYGIHSDLYTNGRETKTGDNLNVITEGMTGSYMPQVNETLARIAYCPDDTDFLSNLQEEIIEHSKDCFLIFISPDCRKEFQEEMANVLKMTDKFIWIIPVSSKSDYRVRPDLVSHTIAWNVYWRKEEKSEVII